MEYTPFYLEQLRTELERVCTDPCDSGMFLVEDGYDVRGATESTVIKHLTSGRDYVSGRQYRFPGIGNGWNFESAINAAGYRLIRATNRRGQKCRIVVEK